MENYIRAFISIVRYIIPFLSVLLVTLCAIGLLSKKKKGYKTILLTDDMNEHPLDNGELLFGSGEDCDILLEDTNEQHGVISVEDNSFSIRPIKKSKITIGRHSVKGEEEFFADDVITAGNRKFSLRFKNVRGKHSENIRFYKASAFCALLLIHFFIMLSMVFAFPNTALVIAAVFALLIIGESLYLFFTKFAGAFIEIPVLFLVGIGLSVVCHRPTNAIIKQAICLIAGIIGAIVLSKILQLPKRAIGFKGVALIIGVALFTVNMVFGVIYNGAQNWLNIASFSFQPSELIKVILIFICGTTVEKISSIKESIPFVCFSVFCLGALFYLSDFGTALIYAVVLVAVLSVRFCSFKLLAVLGGASVLLGTIVIILFPYVAKRIFSFGQAFEHAADSGYQQTRTIIATASGGFFGVGGGNGTLIKVAAADTDIVFGLISEEWGLFVSLSALFCFVLFALYSIKILKGSKSVYYGITACGAAVLLLTQTALNVFGSLDMLPFTGVTLPFISNGGSSLISCMMLTAFLRTPLAAQDRKF